MKKIIFYCKMDALNEHFTDQSFKELVLFIWKKILNLQASDLETVYFKEMLEQQCQLAYF